MTHRVADEIATFFLKHCVSTVFLVSGGGIMHILDGIACNKGIHPVCAHHEGAAAVMAEGYARVTNNFGALVVTTGPGGTNAVTGVVDAWIDSIPMLVISGQTKRSQNVYNSGLPDLRSLGGQEVNILPIVESFTKYSAMVNDPNDILFHLKNAAYHAMSGRPGPSWLDIPLDVQAAIIDTDELKPFEQPKEDVFHRIRKAQICEVCDLLREAERPVIIAGNGIRLANAIPYFMRFVDQTKIPVVVTKPAQDIIPYDHPCYAGFGGTKGTRSGNFAMQNADLILAIGARLAIPFIGYEYELFGKNAVKIVVDIDPVELQKKTVIPDISICADAGVFLESIIDETATAPIRGKTAWLERCQHWKQKYTAMSEPVDCMKDATDGRICTYNFFDTLSRCLSNNAIVIADAGTSYCIVSQVHRVKRGQRVITPAALGTMGFSLPLGIGAYFASPSSAIVAVTGDGSLQMNIQELQTVVHNDVPLKLFVINNGGYVSIRNTQNSYFEGRLCGADASSGVSFPDLRKIAFAYGIHYERIAAETHMDSKISRILGYDRAVICEVFTHINQNIIPSVSSKVLPDGRMVSMPLEDMYPYLPRDEFQKEMTNDD